MLYTLVPIKCLEPLTFGADYVAIEDSAGEAWKKGLQALHPRLLPQLKESALLAEEESEFCVAGGVFDYPRGQEFVIDGTEFVLSHCAESFIQFLMEPEQCLQVVEGHREALANLNVTEADRSNFATLCSWWEQGNYALFLQHM